MKGKEIKEYIEKVKPGEFVLGAVVILLLARDLASQDWGWAGFAGLMVIGLGVLVKRRIDREKREIGEKQKKIH